MEELQTRAPQAHEHLSVVQDPVMRELLAQKLHGLTHVELVTERPTLENSVYEHIPPAEHSDEQAELYQGTAGLLTEVSRFTAQASAQLEAERPSDAQEHRPQIADVFARAKALAVDEAVTAKKEGDQDKTKHAVESLIAIGLVGESRRDSNTSEVQDIVAAGLADEFVTAIRDTRGIVAVDNDGYAISDSTRRYSDDCDLLRIATNRNFDVSFAGDDPLVRSDSPSSGELREAIIDSLSANDLVALAQDAAENKHNTSQGAYLALKALKKIEERGYYEESRGSSEGLAAVLQSAADLVEASGDDEAREMFHETIAALRDMRLAGLQPYRTNNDMTGRLDRAIVKLVHSGHEALAKELMSASRHEIEHHGDEQVLASSNLGHPALYSEDVPDEDRQKTIESLRRLHTEKTNEFLATMEANGVGSESARLMLGLNSTPDTVLDIPPAFWVDYFAALGTDKDGKKLDHEARDVKSLAKLIEIRERDIRIEAEVVWPLLKLKASDGFNTSYMFHALDNLTDEDAKATFTEIVSMAMAEGADPADYTERLNTLFELMSRQKYHAIDKVWDVAIKVYGDKEAALTAMTQDQEVFEAIWGTSLGEVNRDIFYENILDTARIFGVDTSLVKLLIVDQIKKGEMPQEDCQALGITTQGELGVDQLQATVDTLRHDLDAAHEISVERLVSYPLLGQIAHDWLSKQGWGDTSSADPEVRKIINATTYINHQGNGKALWELASEMYGDTAVDAILADTSGFLSITKEYLDLDPSQRELARKHFLKSYEIFGGSITKNCLLAVTDIMEGDAPNESLAQLGITKSGEAGIDQLKAFFGTFRAQLFERGEVSTDLLLSNPLALDIFKTVVRYEQSEFDRGHSDLMLQGILEHDRDHPPQLPDGYAIGEIRVEMADIEARQGFQISEDGVSQWQSLASALERAHRITDSNGHINWTEMASLLGEIQASAGGRAEDIDRGLSAMQDRIATLMANGKDVSGITRKLEEQQAAKVELEAFDFTSVDNFTISTLTEQVAMLSKHRDIVQTGQLQTLLMAVAMSAGAANNTNTPVPAWDATTHTPNLDEVQEMSNFVSHIVNQETWADLFDKVGGRKTLDFLLTTEALDDNIRRSNAIATTGTRAFRILPAKGALLELSGHIGDACWATKYESITDQFPNFTAVTFVQNPDDASRRLAGAALLIETTSADGEPLLVIRGVNPLQNVITQLSAESFYEEFTSYVKEIGDRLGRKVAIVIDDHSGGSGTNRPTLHAFLDGRKANMAKVRLASEQDTTFNGYNIIEKTYLVD